jgi:2-keto-4-pentenoate hydratase/2-oxohepta-3-ene-1,7-dioic acid hydratase in catechol pathway
MKLVNFQKEGRNALGILTDKGVIDVSAFAREGEPATMREALELGLTGTLAALEPVAARADRFLDPEGIVLAPPVDDPEKILGIGKNYLDHAKEMPDLFRGCDAAPEIFPKFRNALVPQKGLVRLNPNSRKHDYESEVAVIIGKPAWNVSEEEAMDYVFGYTLANDVTARDLQKAASQWTPGKTCDTFCPLGPWIVTADEVRPDAMHLTGYKNGEKRQDGFSGDMIYSIPALVSFLSRCCTLAPGGVILTGTPAGVILGRPPEKQDWLKAGDELTVHVPEIGTLHVTVTD